VTPEPRALTDADAARVAEYVDGAMDLDERMAFEARMAAEDELARAVESFERGDELMRSWFAQRGAARPPFRHLRGWMVGLLAMAAGLVVILYPLRTGPSGRIAVVPAARAVEGYGRLYPELADLRPTVAATRRSGAGDEGPEVHPDTARFVEALDRRSRQAFQDFAPDSVVRAEFFRVPIEVDEASTVVVYRATPAGAPRRLFPGDELPLDPHVGPGRTWLPDEPVRRTAGGLVLGDEYAVPRNEARVIVVVGLRAGRTAAGEDLVRTLDEAADLEVLRARLEDEGFDVTSVEVVDPGA